MPPSDPGTAAEEIAPETDADAPDPNAPRVVPESWETVRRSEENVDSVAVWAGDGSRPWLLATAEDTDRLLVYDADSGEVLREVGARGRGAGQFRRPQGIAVVDALAFVVEGGNGRVQVLRLPGLSSLGFVGGGELSDPKGLAVVRTDALEGGGDPASYELWVSDGYDRATDPDLTRRLRHYRVRLAGGGLEVEPRRVFGDAEGAGALYAVKALGVDPGHDSPGGRGRLLVADQEETRMGLRDYAPDGSFRGTVVGGFDEPPAGLALYPCPDGAGYWLATDQHEERTRFRVFDRASLEPLGSFVGEVTADTDGVWLSMVPTPEFPAGAFYAVHDDRSVTAFDWRHVADALGLRVDCAGNMK